MGQPIQARYLSFAGRLQAELGDYEQAHQHLEAAIEGLGEAADVDTAFVLTSWAHVALLEGGEPNLRLGLEQARRAIELLTGTDWMVDLASAHHTAAQLHLSLLQSRVEGKDAPADAALASSTEAKRLAAICPLPPEDYCFTHSRALRAVGHEAEANEHLHQAYERMMLIASKTQDESLRRGWLENVRDNREIVTEWEARGKRS